MRGIKRPVTREAIRALIFLTSNIMRKRAEVLKKISTYPTQIVPWEQYGLFSFEIHKVCTRNYRDLI